VPVFRKAGADWLTFHVECADDPERVLRAIEESGAKPGMALKPATPAEALYPYGERLHCVTVMTVEPGFGGQKLMEGPLEKVRQLKERFPHLVVEVDGGVNEETAPLVRQAGADLLVAGTAVFRAERPAEAMARLRGE
jgi:ribulose-phosphate 3-epimerase